MNRDAERTRDPAEEDLIHQVLAGNEDAFALLFDRHLQALTRHARRWLPNQLRRRVSVADVLQEARITALRRSLEFEYRGPSSVRNWLLKILELKVREAVAKHAGTAQRAVGREVSRGGRPDTCQFVARATSPSEGVAAAETRKMVDQAYLTLPAHYREVLRLARVERLTLREIGVRIGCSREAVKKRYARALARFTRAFDRIRETSDG